MRGSELLARAARTPSRSQGANVDARIAGGDSGMATAWAWLVCPTILLFASIPLMNLVARGILVVFMVWFVWVAAVTGKRVVWPAPLVGFLVWTFIAAAVSLLALDAYGAFRKWLAVFGLGVMGIGVSNAVVWSRHPGTWVHAYLIASLGAYLSNYLPIDAYIAVDYETEIGGRFVGTLGNANAFGRTMVQAFMLGLALLVIRGRGFGATLIILAMGVFGLAVFESGSRTAILGLAIGVAAFYFCVRIRDLARPLNFAALWVVTLAIMVVAVYFPERFAGAVSRIYNLLSYLGLREVAPEPERSLVGRLSLARTAVDTWLQHPMGIGLDNFRVIAGTYAHSNYLEILVSSGILGFVAYYAGFAALARDLRNRWRTFAYRGEAWFFVAVGVVVFAMDAFSVTYYSKSFWLFLAVICGVYAMRTTPGSFLSGPASHEQSGERI